MSVCTGFGKCLGEKCVCHVVKREKEEIRTVKILFTARCFAETRLYVDFCISAVGPSLVKESRKDIVLNKNWKLYFLGQKNKQSHQRHSLLLLSST